MNRNKHLKYLKALIFCAPFFFVCSRAPKEPVIAVVGNRQITKHEFVHRVELSPLPKLAGNQNEKITKLVELLINEKLMAIEAQRQNLDTSNAFQRMVEFADELAVARELYLEEVRDKVQISPQDIEQAASKMVESRTVSMILTQNKEQAESYKRRIEQGEPFAHILQDFYGLNADSAGHQIMLSWGEGEAVLDDAIFALQMGQISDVIPTSRGYAIARLDNIERAMIQTQSEHAKLLHRAEKVLRSRREAVRSDEFVSDFLKDKQVRLERNVFPHFADAIVKQIDFAAPRSDDRQKIDILQNREFELARHELENINGDILVRFRNGQWTIQDVLQRWSLCKLPLDQSSPQSCRRSIVRNISVMIRDKFLSDEGKRRGYQKRPPVQREVNMWRDHFLYTLLKNQLATSRGKSFDWTPYLQQLRGSHKVQIDTSALKDVELSTLPFLAVRPGQYASLVVPVWPSFE